MKEKVSKCMEVNDKVDDGFGSFKGSAWVEDDAAGFCALLHQTSSLRLAERDTGTLRVTSSVRQRVCHRHRSRARNESSTDLQDPAPKNGLSFARIPSAT